MKSLGLYIHIPFCRSKCAYCDFYSLTGDQDTMERYLSALLAQLPPWGRKAVDYRVDTIYIGGGTPSWFGAERVAILLDGIRRAFCVEPDCEITMEANPDSVTRQGLEVLHRAGVNRLSMGVQSTFEEELKIAGRPHSFGQAVQAVMWAREAGFVNLSLDLIYGLPGQSMSQWQESVRRVLALKPEHLSCYGLKIEPGTPFWYRQEELALPDEDAQADAYLWLCRQLEQEGFRHYEISNFAKPGYASRHNVRYWTMKEYLGLGPGAHSDFAGVRFGFARDLQAWLQGACPLSEHREIAEEERLEEYIMLSLRLDGGICRQDYLAYGGTCWEAVEKRLEFFGLHGLLQRQGERWHCTERGFLVSNGVIAELLEAAGL